MSPRAAIDLFDLRVVLDVSTRRSRAKKSNSCSMPKETTFDSGQRLARLQYDLSQDDDERLPALGLNARELSAETQRLHALQLADEAAKKILPEQQVDQIQRASARSRLESHPSSPPASPPQNASYQLQGFHFLAYLSANRFGGLLADDMGLGKTLQTLAWLLVVAPAKIVRASAW